MHRDRMIKVILAEVIPDIRDKPYIDQRMEELEQLVYTLGGMEIVQVVQQRIKPDYTSYLGKGKVEEVIELMQETGAEILIIGNILKPRQVYHLGEKLRPYEMQVWDRIDLILKIFGQHAQSTEARLQIELAAIKHMGPRIFNMGMELGRQSGGSGGGGGSANRGSGETNTEIMKRHLQTRRSQISKDLKKYESVRKVHRQGRSRNHLPTIGVVGYTNAGKSSLMHMLTGKEIYIADKLFATLGTNVGKLYIPSMTGKGTELLINDTIGFIRDLPPSLIQAFTSTLEDSVHADILLHVVDAGDPMIDDKIGVVDTILDQIGAEQERVLVFNKVDQVISNKEQGTRKGDSEKLETRNQKPETGGSEGGAVSERQLESGESVRAVSNRPVEGDVSEALSRHGEILQSEIGMVGSEDWKEKLLAIAESHGYEEVYFVSAHTGEGKEELVDMMVEKTRWR